MTMTIASVSGRSHVLAKPFLSKLVNVIARRWSMIVPLSNEEILTQEAIAIFRDPSASADRCEWAERYLCGMVDKNGDRGDLVCRK